MTTPHGPLAVLVARFLGRCAAITLVLATATASAQTSIDDAREAFATADDRRAVVERLLPGSEARAYYEALLAIHEGRWEEFDRLAADWGQRAVDPRFEALVARRMLLGFRADPERTWRYLLDELAPQLDHRSPAEVAARALPSRVDPAELTEEAFLRRALGADRRPFAALNEGTRRAVRIAELDSVQRRDFLRCVERPDLPGLVEAIALDLAADDDVEFGTHPIHARLTLAQLDELAAAQPPVLSHERFVATYLARLAPSPDEAWRTDDALLGAYLDRLEAFTARLPAGFDGLRAHVLQHRLRLEQRRGTVTAERLLEYLRVARRAPYLRAELRRERRAAESDVAPPGLDPLGDDAAFVRELVIALLQGGASHAPFAALLDDDWLLQVRAEAALLGGGAIPPEWTARLGPAWVAALEQRVEIRFPAGNPRVLGAREPVRIEVETKNVDALVVEVFEIDAFDFYRERKRPIDAELDLDAVVPHRSERIAIDAPAARRVRRTIDFPDLVEPGTYVIEFSGGGVASRILVEKGHLELVERVGAAGHLLGVVDERGERLRDARIWFDGRELVADARGECVLPFATVPGRKTLILRHGRRAALASIEHESEAYTLSAAVHIDREALLPGRTAPILVRPRLDVHGEEVSLALLEDAALTLIATRNDGVRATRVVRDLELRDDAELVVEHEIPEGTARLDVHLAGRMRWLADGEFHDMRSDASAFRVDAALAQADLVEPYLARPYLVRDGEELRVELRGPNGEPKPGVVVDVMLRAADAASTYHATLASDVDGRIHLGDATHLVALTVQVRGKFAVDWRLRETPAPWSPSVHVLAGASVRLPVPLDFAPREHDVSVLEVRRGAFVRDAGASARHESGAIVLEGLAPGDYDVAVPVLGLSTVVRVTRAAADAGVAINAARRLELSAPRLSIAALALRDGTIEVALRDADPSARVHLVARRFFPEDDGAARLGGGRVQLVDVAHVDPRMLAYLAQRPLGDEQRYILARRFAPRYLGNLLERRGLLLHPWASDETSAVSTEIGIGGAGGGGGRGAGRAGRFRGPSDTVPPTTDAHSDFAFLPSPARIVANLRPDADGIVRVSFAELGLDAGLHHVEAIAVDRSGAQRAQAALAAVAFEPLDRRLAEALPAEGTFGEERRLEFVRAGAALESATDGVARRSIGRLADLFATFRSLSGEPELSRFEFLTRWSALSRDEKLALYDQFACHELHVFLRLKDRAFFDAVVRPYLANKGERTFLDEWLLDGDVRPWLETARFERLNTAERVLLLERLGEPPARIVRELDHALARAPLDHGDLRRRFEAALLGGAAAGEVARVRVEAKDSTGRAVAPAPAQSAVAAQAEAEERAVEVVDPTVAQELAKLGYVGGDDFDADVARRATVRGFARRVGPTQRLVETHWWRRRLADGSPATTGTRFWRDYALRDRDAPFLSPHVLEATGSLSELLLALAVSDLATGDGDAFERDGESVRARVDALVLARRVAALPATDAPRPLLVAAEIVAARATSSGPARRVDTLVAGVPYRMRVVVTNPTPDEHAAELLVQVPAGAVALDGLGATRSTPIALAPWSTHPVEALFYFPRAGSFAHGPAHVRIEGGGASRLAAVALEVLPVAPDVGDDTFEGLAARGSSDEVLQALRERDLATVDLGAIAWRMADPAFFAAATDVLRSRFVYHHGLWAYALRHRDVRAAAEYLARTKLAQVVAPVLRSELLVVDPFVDRAVEFAEFAPRINSRAHPEAGIAGVRDARMESRYAELLRIWALEPELSERDRLELAYHHLSKERIHDALRELRRVERGSVRTALQHDYMLAHAAFFTGDVAAARRLAEPHRDHPVARWRTLFRAVLDVADAAEGRAPSVATEERAAEPPPLLELALERDRAALVHAGLGEVEVNFYSIDLEFQFSADPFGERGGEGTGHVRPHASRRIAGAPARTRTEVAIPPELVATSLIVEARGGGLVRRALHQPSALTADFDEQGGRLVVREGERPAAGVYVKVYSRQPSGAVLFHKDGYTDVLGRFDYAAVSGVEHEIARFAVLVLDERRGALVRDLAPPPR